MKKPIIEHENLDLDSLIQYISHEGRKEKNSRVPLNDLFYWWTRKPLSFSRASVLLSILENQSLPESFINSTKDKLAALNKQLKKIKLDDEKMGNDVKSMLT